MMGQTRLSLLCLVPLRIMVLQMALTENVSSLTARICKIEAHETSLSGASGSASSWNLLGQSDGSTATGPLGPMARGRLTTTRTQDADLTLSQAQRMSMHELPFCYTFRLNNTTRECLLGSRSSGQRPTHQPSTSLLEFIAKQVPYPLDLYLKQELNVKALWHDTKMIASPTK